MHTAQAAMSTEAPIAARPPIEPTAVRHWHAHVYFDGPAQRAAAAALRAQVAQRFPVQLGRWHEGLVGPHTRAMYMLAFETASFPQIVPFLALNRQGLDILLHPNTGAPRDDHLRHALWLGRPLPVKEAVLPLTATPDEDEPPRINSWPDQPGL